jgi:aspartate kinase
MNLVVQKYGGTSVGSLDHIKNVAKHVAATVRAGNRLVVTISAMGEQTDDLLAMASKLHPKPPRRELDMLLTAGERISMALLAIALDERGIPSLSLTGSQCGILTDETHGNARITQILGDRIRDGLKQERVVIVAGFQGVSPRTKEITTLGRGGSDLSALALASVLKATICQLYKDVDGVYTADPRIVKNASVLPTISWEAMTELAWSGANVLHARGAHVAHKFSIPFEIRSSVNLLNSGTTVKGHALMESAKIEAIAHKSSMSILEMRVQGNASAQPHQLYSASSEWLWQQGEAPQLNFQALAANGEICLTLLIKSSLVPEYIAAMSDIAAQKGLTCRLEREQNKLGSITVVGQGFKQSPEVIGKVMDCVKQLVLFETRTNAITIAVPEDDLLGTVNLLHKQLLETVT